MTSHHSIRGMGLALALSAILAVPGLALAQGGNTTPRPPGSDPSARVDQLQGLPPSSPGTPGNPTGRAIDRPMNPPAANALPVPAAPGTSGTAGATTPGNQRATGRTGGSAPSN